MAQSDTVTATSLADNTKSASAMLSLAPGLDCGDASIGVAAPGQSATFNATVSGTRSQRGAIWTVTTRVGTGHRLFYTAFARSRWSGLIGHAVHGDQLCR